MCMRKVTHFPTPAACGHHPSQAALFPGGYPVSLATSPKTPAKEMSIATGSFSLACFDKEIDLIPS